MTDKELLNKVKQYVEKQYQDLMKYKNDEYFKLSVQATMSRCVGVIMFAQNCGIDYKDLSFYDEYADKFRKLLFE